MREGAMDGAKVEIRTADFEDVRQVEDFLTLMDHFALDPMGGGKPLSADVRERVVPAILERPSVCVLLAYVDDAAAGFATCIEGFSSFAARPLLNVHDLMVEPEWRGHGVGRALLEAVESLARSQGCCKLTLEVLTGNTRAQSVYRAFGFRGYGFDPEHGHAVFIEKPLTSAMGQAD